MKDSTTPPPGPLGYYTAQLNHPLIAALPPLPEESKNMNKELEHLPVAPDDAVRRLRPNQRLQLTGTLRAIHFPGPRDAELAYHVDMLIRDGLSARPLTAQYYATAKTRIAGLVESVMSAQTATPARIQSPCGSLIGRSGEGKTRACQRVLDRYPKVIVHDTRANPLLPAKQVISLHVECPSDRTISSLVVEFVRKLELAIGEKIPARFKQGNRSTLISNIGELCETYWVGLIVLDECQHALKKGMPELELMNFLVEMSNKLSVPILYVGTPLALKLIGGQLRQARRMIGVEWKGFDENDPQWLLFLSAIWPYQFTSTFTALDDKLRATIYDYSQGIPALAIALYQLAQQYAITAGGGEEIVPERFQVVYEDYFKPVHPMIEALKSKDPVRIAQFEDLSHTEETSEWFEALSKLRQDLRIKGIKKIANTHKRVLRQMVKSSEADAKSFARTIPSPAAVNESLMQTLMMAKQLGLDPAEILKNFLASNKEKPAA